MDNLWDKPGLPHKGWECDDVRDIEEATHTCEMCGKEEIRYVHVLRRPDRESELLVGCVCAEKMCEGYDAKGAENRLKNRIKRRNSFRVGWRETENGNWKKTKKGVLIIIGRSQYGGFWMRVGKNYLKGNEKTFEAACDKVFEEIDEEE